MAANQWLRFEQRSVIKVLVAEKCKPLEIYRRMFDAYGEAYSSQKIVCKCTKHDEPELKRQSMEQKHTDPIQFDCIMFNRKK